MQKIAGKALQAPSQERNLTQPRSAWDDTVLDRYTIVRGQADRGRKGSGDGVRFDPRLVRRHDLHAVGIDPHQVTKIERATVMGLHL